MSAIDLVSLIVLGLCGVYALLILYNTPWKSRCSKPEADAEDLRLSIIVPYRNEEQNLLLLLHDLKAQRLDPSLMEVLFVNDSSEDASRELLEAELKKLQDSRFQSLSLKTSGGKKAALASGIEKAAFDYIVQLDADCRIEKDFLQSHYRHIQKHKPDLLAGAVAIEEGSGLLSAFESLDQMALTGISIGSFDRGRALMCSGANLLYTRQLYEQTRSFDPGLASGDDMFLMMGARKLGRKLAYNSDPDSMVRTRAATSLRELITQRIRWGSKTTAYPIRGIQFMGLVVFLCSLALLLLPLLYTMEAEPGILFLALGLKVLADFPVLYLSSGLMSRRHVLWYFPMAQLLHPPFIVLSALGGLLAPLKWKGRS